MRFPGPQPPSIDAGGLPLAIYCNETELCVKIVVLAGETYRYAPAQSLLVSADLPLAAPVVGASPIRPCLAVRRGAFPGS